MSQANKILAIVGARPNFMKIVCLADALNRLQPGIEFKILHTLQHYDPEMSDDLLRNFNLEPDFRLSPLKDCSESLKFAHILKGISDCIFNFKPELIVVVGDVTSTLYGALAGYHEKIPVAHIESGLRSFDRSMPEEFNRMIADQLSDLLFVTEPSGIQNLKAEGILDHRVHHVGNTMIDALLRFSEDIEKNRILQHLGLEPKTFALATFHRPSNVDSEPAAKRTLAWLETISQSFKTVFPIHPRTKKKFSQFGLSDALLRIPQVIMVPPCDYLSFQKLLKECAVVVTDSGGVQEETTYYDVPCLTLRPNTERPITTEIGTNILCPLQIDAVDAFVKAVKNGKHKKRKGVPDKWDGLASERIAQILLEFLEVSA